jgi:hypothetical protein
MLSDYKLTLRDDGVAELEYNGRQVWASDSDEDLLEDPDVGKNGLTLRGRDMGHVLDYLVAVGKLTEQQADDCIVEIPEDDPVWDEDEDEEDEEDEAQYRGGVRS